MSDKKLSEVEKTREEITGFRTVREMIEASRGDPFGVGVDPELRISLIDATLIRFFRNRKEETFEEWKNLVQTEVDSEDWMDQHVLHGTQEQLAAHKYMLDLVERNNTVKIDETQVRKAILNASAHITAAMTEIESIVEKNPITSRTEEYIVEIGFSLEESKNQIGDILEDIRLAAE